MGSNQDPNEVLAIFDRKGSVVDSYSDLQKFAYFFEMEGWRMGKVGF
jgi:hypothetical protein